MPVISAVALAPVHSHSSIALHKVRAGHVSVTSQVKCMVSRHWFDTAYGVLAPEFALTSVSIWLYSLLSSYFWTVIEH